MDDKVHFRYGVVTITNVTTGETATWPVGGWPTFTTTSTNAGEIVHTTGGTAIRTAPPSPAAEQIMTVVTRQKDCEDCHGTGKYTGFFQVEPCQRCKGTGKE